LEGVVPPRPLTHDLIKNLIETFGYQLSEVMIDELSEGTFQAKLIFDNEGIQIDCRPSDAIAIAVRTNVPITVSSDIMDEAGVIAQPNDPNFPDQFQQFSNPQKEALHSSGNKRLDILQNQLDKAVKDENYEVAAKIRDEIKKLLESS
jgi:hypothetical protein